MTRPTAAYEYGVTLGALQIGAARMMEQIAAGMRDAHRAAALASGPVTIKQVEELRVRQHRLRIERERRLGRQQVAAHAARARRDLGLPDA